MLISLGGKRQQLSALEVLFETVFGGSNVLGGFVLHVFFGLSAASVYTLYFIPVDIVCFNWWILTQKWDTVLSVTVVNEKKKKFK